jgi:protein-disulfide isomerase
MIQGEMKNNNKYKTHWHSFWFGFMSALSIVLFCLLIGVVTNKVSFGTNITSKKTPIQKTTTTKPKFSIDTTLTELKIDKEEFDKCMNEKKHADTVQANIDSGRKAGVKGTPHSFVLVDDAIYEIPGAQSEKGMREFFDDLLANNTLKAKDISEQKDIDPVTDDDWIKGKETAKITVIEYSDLDCPYCNQFHKSTLAIMTDYKDDVRWVFRHMPIDSLHPNARQKAEAAECIGDLGGGVAFWEYLDKVFN